jgi:hypothetical protein
MGDQEEEENFLELVLVRRESGASVNRRFGRELGELHDGTYTEAPASVHISNDNRLNQVNIENGYEPSLNTSRKVIDFLLKWGWVPIVFVLGSILVVAYIAYTNRDVTPVEIPVWNTTTTEQNLKISVNSSMCNYNYTCTCSSAVNAHVGCCSGCYLAESMGQCGLTVNVQYWNISKARAVSKIYLLVTADGVDFWQTGYALPVTGIDLIDMENPHLFPASAALYTNGTGIIKDGCFGTQASVAIIGCLTTKNLTATKTRGFPAKACDYVQGICTRLNNVWTTGKCSVLPYKRFD